jgi:AcrR family transcriptional regulator
VTQRRRQEDRTQATRAALITTARRLFAQRGYHGVPAEEIVAAAGLTRGALQHHFGDKQALFRAVFEQLETEISTQLATAVARAPDGWAAATAALSAFLDACEKPEVIQIALTDAPAVLGWATWRAVEGEHGLGLITTGLRQGMADGVFVEQPVDVLAHLILSAVIEAALLIAHAPNHRAARKDAEQTLLALLAGLRTPATPRQAKTQGMAR